LVADRLVFFIIFIMNGGEEKSEAESVNSPVVNQQPKIVPINHMAVKPIPFSTKNPETWFRQMESQFHLARISSAVTKYHYVLSALPEEVVNEIPLDSAEQYEVIKQKVLENLKGNKHQLIDQALSAVSLNGKRPTQIINEIRRRFADVNISADDALIKSRLLSALPPNIKAALVGHDSQPLEDYAKIADSMMAVAGENPYAINAMYQPPAQQHFSHSGVPEISGVGQTSYHSNYNPRHHQPSSLQHSERPRQFSAVRPFYKDQRPKLCNAHIFYADRARTCRPWCKWPIKRQRMLRDNEATPVQSRHSSPVKNA